MTQPVPDIQAGRSRLPFYLTLAGVLLIACLLFYVVWAPTPVKTTTPSGPPEGPNTPDQAKKVLSRDTDLNPCRTSLQQINSALLQDRRQRPPGLSPEQRDGVRKLVELDEGELAEIEGSTY